MPDQKCELVFTADLRECINVDTKEHGIAMDIGFFLLVCRLLLENDCASLERSGSKTSYDHECEVAGPTAKSKNVLHGHAVR